MPKKLLLYSAGAFFITGISKGTKPLTYKSSYGSEVLRLYYNTADSELKIKGDGNNFTPVYL